jgi:hypothetical protein
MALVRLKIVGPFKIIEFFGLKPVSHLTVQQPGVLSYSRIRNRLQFGTLNDFKFAPLFRCTSTNMADDLH